MNRFLTRRNALYAGVGLVAAGVAVALILVSVLGGGDKKATTTAAVTTTAPATTGGSTTTTAGPALAGASETQALLQGIPQRLNELGDPKAPVTMVEFADLQCPFCRDYAVDALPAIVREYVRPGKTKLVFDGMAFLGPDSETALRAVYAAGIQGKLWNFLDLLYRNQGAENSGWVTEGILRKVGDSIPGFDTEKMLADRQSSEVDAALAASSQQAQSAGVNSTPTFFAGPTGGTLQHVAVTALKPEAFRPTLDALVK